jgi:hypothetical protein
MDNSNARNLRQLAWVVAQQDEQQDNIERAYALDAFYVYRRELDLSQEHPRPKYWRATHRDVLSNECNWGDLDPAIWTDVSETGQVKS